MNAIIPDAESAMKKLGKSYAAKVYDGANLKASPKAWPATIAFFRKRL